MPHAFVRDEHFRGPLWQAILRHNLSGTDPLDVVCVGNDPDLPLGSNDSNILLWCEREHRILVTEDRSTMATHLRRHLDSGRHSPGILMVRSNARIRDLLETLQLTSHVMLSAELDNTITFIP